MIDYRQNLKPELRTETYGPLTEKNASGALMTRSLSIREMRDMQTHMCLCAYPEAYSRAVACKDGTRLHSKIQEIIGFGQSDFKDMQLKCALSPRNLYLLASLSPDTKRDKQVTLAAIYTSPNFIMQTHPSLQDDFEVVIFAVSRSGTLLMYASNDKQNNKTVVMAAVTNNGHAIQYASPAMRRDREIITAAVRQNGYARIYLTPELQNDPEILAVISDQYSSPLPEYAFMSDLE